jgi:hypothetical protein
MKRLVSRLCRIVGAAILLGTSSLASAQTVSCNANFCTYGPICPDAWGGCFFYSWWIGSGVNTVSEKAGLANVIKQCKSSTDTTCVRLSSAVELIVEDNTPNVFYQCRGPGSDTCTGGGCGGSPDSGGNPHVATIALSTSVTGALNPDGCVKEKGSGALKCSKTNTVPILEGQEATFCPNKNWKLQSYPLYFKGKSTLTGPISKQSLQNWTTTLVAKCTLLDPAGKAPQDYPDYHPSAIATENRMVCSFDSIESAPAP